MIVHCDVDRTIEYQTFVSGRLRERGNGFVSGTLYRYQSRRSPERKVAEPHSGIKLVCRRAGVQSVHERLAARREFPQAKQTASAFR
jgi:hypothetical protein